MVARKTTLDMFIPEDRRQSLARGESLPTRTHGAVMFADVSGFTRLTGIFSAELGPKRGAEALTQLLDPIYAELVDALHSFRGSVIVISGDGITCWFEQDDGLRATACAFAMQAIMARHAEIRAPGGRVAALGIKIALSVGVVQRFLVGDPDIQLLEALAGHEVDQVVSIHDVLERGDVAIRADLLSKMEDRVSVEARRQTAEGAQFAIVRPRGKLVDPHPWPTIPALEEDVARRWVYRSVYVRLEEEELEFLTELRQAVPIFVKFAGIEYDRDEHAGEKLDQFVRCVQRVIEQYEGYLCQLTIGGRGTNAFIAFGAPIAHEDNVDRALAAALKLQEETAKLGFIQPLQIGLTQGQLWAGAHGGGAARTYSIIGSEVNLAHRLMSQTRPGQILVSPHVAENAPNYLFEQVAPITLKGIEKPMAPYLLLGRAKTSGAFSNQEAMLGRVLERGILTLKLTELLSEDRSASDGIIIIEGDAGIGKSRLLADFMKRATDQGVRVLFGEADPVERGTPYFAFRQVLEAVFELAEDKDLPTARESILAALGSDEFLLERAPLLGEILPLQWRDNELTSQILGEPRAQSIREVVLGVLRNALTVNRQRIPTVLVLDDAHWLDSASWNLLGYLARELQGILFVISLRPLAEEPNSQAAAVYARLCSHPAAQPIQLSRLSLTDASHLIEQKLDITALPNYLLEFIWARSQGNPFFTEQIAYALRDAGIIRIENHTATLEVAADELNHIDFPATLQGIITSRIDRLSPSQQLTLKVASVIGRVFLLRMLETVHPARPGTDALVEQLFALTRLGITDPDQSSPGESYLFRHIITQEVIYGLLTFAQRKQLHCEIAEWYEQNHQNDQSAYYSRLAHHWLNGEATNKAIHFLDKAAVQSAELFANEDVLRFLSAAIDLDERARGKVFDLRADPQRVIQRARWERMLGVANLKLGRLADSLKHYKNALRLLGHPVPETGLQIGRGLLKELFIQASNRIRGYARRDNIHSQARETHAELAKIGVADALFYAQNAPQLAWSYLFRLNMAERAGSAPDRASAYTGLMLIATFVQNAGLINLYRKLAWQAVDQADQIGLRMHLHLMDGVASFISCDWQRADGLFDAGVKLAEQIGDLREYASLVGAWTGSIFLQGKYEECLAVWVGVHEKLARKDIHQNLTWSVFGQGLNLLMLGDMESALSRIETSLSMLRKSSGDSILTTFTYGALSLAHLRQGQYARALENILTHEQKAPAPSASSILFYYAPVVEATLGLYGELLSGRIEMNESDRAQVVRLAGRMPNYLNAMKNLPVNKTGVWLYKGIYFHLAGRDKEAIAAWRKSMEFARRFAQPYELARASLELGRHPGLNLSERQAHLTEACAMFETLKTPFELARARSALAALTNATTG